MEDSSKEEQEVFIQQNKLLFKKYKPLKLIGKGTFSDVYLSLNTKTNKYVAIKAEKKCKNGVELLESEAFLLYSLRGFGIPQVLSYGRTKTHNILVLPLLGKSLLDLFIYKNKNISINDICLIAIQILDRIEWIHSNNIVYRDIKPENFLFGKKDPEVLYLIDFGLCRKYRSSTTGKHIKPKNMGKFTGTSRYASLYAMAGNEQSRRDDIESIGYMIIFLMKKKLPWQGIKGNSYKECYHKLYLMKKYIEMEELCKGLPSEIIDYMNNARSLKFEEEPNYKYLKSLFNNILKKCKFKFENNIFSWVDKIDINNNIGKSNSVGKMTNNKMNRKSSPQNRIFNKIKKSLENKKNLIPLNSNLRKVNQKNEKIDYVSTNTDQTNNKSQSKDIKFNKSINYLNYKNEANSELSNTMKVMFNKNINSGYNENIGNFPRVSSENNIYHENIFSFRANNEQKKKSEKNYSPQNERFNNILYLNQNQFSTKKNNKNEKNNYGYISNINNVNNNINDNKKEELKKIQILNNNNNTKLPGKIIKISPSKNLLNNNCSNINNNNKFFKINQITIINADNLNENKNNNSLSIKQNTNENIKYNTYNTYNTYNSFNDTLDKTNTNNNINNTNNNINNYEYIDNNNHRNNKRINHIIYQKNSSKINYNKNYNSTNNTTNYLINNSFNNNPGKLIYLDKYENQNDIHSVNINKKPNNHNIIMNNFNNNRKINSVNKYLNYSKSEQSSERNIKRNNKGVIIKKVGNNNLNNINKMNISNRINISNIKLKQSNSSNKINKNFNVIKHNVNKLNNVKNMACMNNINNIYRKEGNNAINTFEIKNSSGLKRIALLNNNPQKKTENNSNFIRLDKMKNNLNSLQNTRNIYNPNITESSSKKNSDNNEIVPKYNNYKINSLKRIPNNNKVFLKRAFPPYKYQTENDANSVLIHKKNNTYDNNNNTYINNNYNYNDNTNNNINPNNSINISRNKIKYNTNYTSIPNNINNNYFNNYSDRQKIVDNPLFVEIEPKIINDSSIGNGPINKSNNNITKNTFIEDNNNNLIKDNNIIDNNYKTEDTENNYTDSLHNGDPNKVTRINKYKMIRYKGTKN